MPGTFFAGQCWADYIIIMSGIDLRQAQASALSPNFSQKPSRVRLSIVIVLAIVMDNIPVRAHERWLSSQGFRLAHKNQITFPRDGGTGCCVFWEWATFAHGGHEAALGLLDWKLPPS